MNNLNYNTLFVGKVDRHFESLPSTNSYAIELLSKSKPSEGTVISTYHQTAGRGQFGNKWLTHAGKNLTLSVIFYPKFLTPRAQFELNKTIALGVYDFVCAYISKKTAIKWPNDILVEDRKLAGILIQNGLSSGQFSHAVVGIGVNINQTSFNIAGRTPTSFALETHQQYDLEQLKMALYFFLEKRYLQLKFNQHALLQTDYLQGLYRYGVPHRFRKKDGTSFTGIIEGIAPNGQLIINHNGQSTFFGFKEVQFL